MINNELKYAIISAQQNYCCNILIRIRCVVIEHLFCVTTITECVITEICASFKYWNCFTFFVMFNDRTIVGLKWILKPSRVWTLNGYDSFSWIFFAVFRLCEIHIVNSKRQKYFRNEFNVTDIQYSLVWHLLVYLYVVLSFLIRPFFRRFSTDEKWMREKKRIKIDWCYFMYEFRSFQIEQTI